MKKMVFRTLGILSVIAGAILLLGSFSGITGYVVFEEAKKTGASFFGAFFIAIGAAILIASKSAMRARKKVA